MRNSVSNESVSGARSNSLSERQLAAWRSDGYLLVKGLFDPEQVARIRQIFDDIGRGEFIPGFWEPRNNFHVSTGKDDPLLRYPRVMHPHRFNDYCKSMMLHPTVRIVLRSLMGEEPVACQSMFYYKPPGSCGQPLHQDNVYLQVAPETCYAAWTAIDPAMPENGGMYVVPGTQNMQILCHEQTAIKDRVVDRMVDVPKGMKAVPAIMDPGDTLFFNGSIIHGSGRNRHPTLWRRSFICHYMPTSSKVINKHYHPVHDFAGNVISYAEAKDGGPCGSNTATYSPQTVH